MGTFKKFQRQICHAYLKVTGLVHTREVFLKTFLILYQSSTFHVIKFDLLLYLAFKNVFEKIVGSWPLAHTNFLLDIKQTIKNT